MADTFFFRRNGLFYDVVNERTRVVVEELIDCVAEARNYVEEHTAAALEAEQAEMAEAAEAEAVAVTMHVAREAVADAVRDFLHALDRGDFGAGHRFSDGSESAYIAALRQSVAPLEVRA